MNLEQQLRHALARANDYPASPDLFARVTRTLEEDVRHRARVRRTIGGGLAGLASITTFLVALSTRDGGRLLVPWWAFELVVTAALVTLAVALSPMLRRFGQAYLADVLGQDLGRRFATLLDVAYGLLCAGYVLVTATLEADIASTTVDPAQVSRAALRTGGLALTLGLTHTVVIATLPVLGLLLRSTRWRTDTRSSQDPLARTADRVAGVLVGLAAVAFAAGTVIAVLLVVAVGVAP